MTLGVGAAVGWLVLAALALPPRHWQTRYPRAALAIWSGLTVTIYAVVGFAIVGLVVGAADPGADRPWSAHAAGWLILVALGCVWAWAFTRSEELTSIDDAANSTIEALRGAAGYRSQTHGRARVTFLHSDHPTAWAHPTKREIFLTSALVDHLGAAELDAVIAHEGHHLSARHPLLLRVSRLHLACLPTAGVGAVHRRARLLVELAADDYAARRCGVEAVAGALDQLASLTHNDGAALRAYRLRVRAA